MRVVGLILTVCLAGSLLAACGEKPQTAGTRKADVEPSQGAAAGVDPAYTAAGWKAGDATSWETQLKARAQNGQNEYSRIGAR